MPGRCLFVSYYFPPSGGPGVQRTLKLVKYLPEHGWEPVVLTVRPEAAAYPNVDPELIGEVPPAVDVVRTGAWDPYALYARMLGQERSETVTVGFLGASETDWKQRLARWVRANVFLPDARVGWVPYAVARGRRLLAGGGFDAVVTTGPPHSTHLAGHLLSRLAGLPWLADFRDPWTGIDFAEALPMTPLARRLDAALEADVLRRATAVTAVTPDLCRELGGLSGRRVDLVRNGFDPEDFDAPAPAPEAGFVVGYVGNMNAARNPEALWEALRRLEAPVRMPELRVRITGNVDVQVLEAAARHGLRGLVEVEGYRPHSEAVARMRASDLLLVAINQAPNQDGIVPGKLYEYVAAGRPVLVIGPPRGDAAETVAEAGAGSTFGFEDAAGVAAFVRAHYDAWKAGRPRSGAGAEAAAGFSRRTQAGQFAARLDGITRTEGTP